MAQGKGGKADPAKIAASATQTGDDEIGRMCLKLSQAHAIIRNSTRMRVSETASEALMASVTYILAEVVEGAQNKAIGDGKKKILPKHISAAIASDCELNHIGGSWLIKSGGATGHIKYPEEERSKRNRAKQSQEL
jgi:histone H3/H4